MERVRESVFRYHGVSGDGGCVRFMTLLSIYEREYAGSRSASTNANEALRKSIDMGKKKGQVTNEKTSSATPEGSQTIGKEKASTTALVGPLGLAAKGKTTAAAPTNTSAKAQQYVDLLERKDSATEQQSHPRHLGSRH